MKSTDQLKGLKQGQPFGAVFRRKMCVCVCKLVSVVKPRIKPLFFLAQVPDLAVPDHSLLIKA